MNDDIQIEKMSEKESSIEESEEKESEQDEEASQLVIRPEYSQQRISEITPRLDKIMHGSSSGNKNIEKLEVILFEKLFNTIKKKCKYDDIVKVVNLYSEGVIGANELQELVEPHLSFNEDFKAQFMNLMFSRENTRRHKSWFTRPISEFSLADYDVIDKSYSVFPSDFYEQI